MPERNADYWLAKAEEAWARASQLHDPSAVATMLQIAAIYDQLAQKAKQQPSKGRPDKEPDR